MSQKGAESFITRESIVSEKHFGTKGTGTWMSSMSLCHTCPIVQLHNLMLLSRPSYIHLCCSADPTICQTVTHR
jgi:hypothetical protein